MTDSAHSRGVAILIKSCDLSAINIREVHASQDGRILLLQCEIEESVYNIVNIYAPNKILDKCNFFKRLKFWISRHIVGDEKKIIAGDFNTVTEKEGRTGLKSVDKSTIELQKLLKVHKMTDTGMHSSQLNHYTWVNPGNPSMQSRIDYIFASSQMLDCIDQYKVVQAPTPDHKAVVTKLRTDQNKPRGPGYWKLNTSVLNEPMYRDGIRNVFTSTVTEYTGRIAKYKIWELCKIRFKEFSIKYCFRRNHVKKREYQVLSENLDNIESKLLKEHGTSKDELMEKRKNLKMKLDQYATDMAEGARIRSKAQWVEHGEKSSKYFLSLEKARQKTGKITMIRRADNTVALNDEEILKEASKFYANLYTTKLSQNYQVDKYFRKMVKPRLLTPKERELCEGKISIAECMQALKKMKKNKSPGIDGLPMEFYQQFWELIGEYVVNVYNECYDRKVLSDTQGCAVVTLIYKKNEKEFLKNYRPISLMTTDYKILAFVLSNRLHKVLNEIVSTDQNAYIKNRYIGYNLRLLQDIIEMYKESNEINILAFLDYEKAFDTVEWPFLYQTLKYFNFGPDFISWIQTLYGNATMMIKKNGWLSSEISAGVLDKDAQCRPSFLF